MGSITRSFANNILTAGKFDGTKLTGDIPQANLTANAPAFDDNKIVNDLSTLGLRVHTQENLAASNTNSQYVDVFQDSTGYTNGANTIRDSAEFISSVSNNMPTGTELYLKSNSESNNSTNIADYSGNSVAVSFEGGGKHITQGDVPIGAVSGTASTSAFWFDGSQSIEVSHANFETPVNFGTGDFTLATYFRANNASTTVRLFSMGGIGSNADYNGFSWGYYGSTGMKFHYRESGTTQINVASGNMSLSSDTFYHLAVTRQSGVIKFWKDGVQQGSNHNEAYNINMANADSRNFKIGINSDGQMGFQGRMDAMHIVKGTALYTGTFTRPTVYYGTIANATGNFLCPAITAGSATTKMGAVITYQDNAGTNALNSDIVLQLSADNGSNFSTATLTALPDFSSGIKMAKVNDLPVTSGTQLKYKISFANQSSGSKEARIRGVSLNY